MHRFLLPVVLGVLCGCVGRGRPSFFAEDPMLRVAAIKEVSQHNDQSQLGRLIDRLEDEAEEVRLYAVLALRQMTGQQFGFRAHGLPWHREEAVKQWRRWARSRRR